MASKRPAPHIHPSRQDQVPPEPRRKRHKPNNAGPKSFKKAHPVNDLKSQVRSLKRLLERNDDLPANIRVEKERALQTAEHELEKTQKAKIRSEIISRYHKVRFFDRQKAEKRLKRARKLLKACEDGDDGRAELERQVEYGEVAVNYAQYYPLEVPYVSLFPRKKTEEHDEGEDDEGNEKLFPEEQHKNNEVWEQVKECMANGTLDALRNGKLTQDQHSNAGAPANSQVREKNRSGNGRLERRKATQPNDVGTSHPADSDNDSDGGFFE